MSLEILNYAQTPPSAAAGSGKPRKNRRSRFPQLRIEEETSIPYRSIAIIAGSVVALLFAGGPIVMDVLSSSSR